MGAAESGAAPAPKPKPPKKGCRKGRREKHYEAQRFEQSRFVSGKLQFLMRFKGFPKAEWLPAKQLQEDLSPDAHRALRKARV